MADVAKWDEGRVSTGFWGPEWGRETVYSLISEGSGMRAGLAWAPDRRPAMPVVCLLGGLHVSAVLAGQGHRGQPRQVRDDRGLGLAGVFLGDPDQQQRQPADRYVRGDARFLRYFGQILI